MGPGGTPTLAERIQIPMPPNSGLQIDAPHEARA